MKSITECLASNLRDFRNQSRMTQEKLAEVTELSLGTIQLIESEKQWPGIETIDLICEALGIHNTMLFQSTNRTTLIADLVRLAPSLDEEKLGHFVALMRTATTGERPSLPKRQNAKHVDRKKG